MRRLTLFVLVAACTRDLGDTAAEPPGPPGCGNGVVEGDESCDDGGGNADDTPDACRADCSLPSCGDGVADAGETCDDGETWGGDGCDPRCATEIGSAEVEPNDAWSEATPAAGTVSGAIPAGDVDCWSVELPACGGVAVEEVGACQGRLRLSLHDPDGAMLAAGSPGADGCARIDPAEEPGARWLPTSGAWSVCASSIAGAEVRGYTLAISPRDPGSLAAAEPGDLDRDGIPAHCDDDDDGDGVADDADTCPDLSNGPATALALSPGGFLRDWLVAGPYIVPDDGSCRASGEVRVGEPDVAPRAGDPAGERAWEVACSAWDDLDLDAKWMIDATPREAYVAAYLRSDSARDLTLAVGTDDGALIWWNGDFVLETEDCAGRVTMDRATAPVAVVAGINTLLFQIRDYDDGDWRVLARLLDASGAAVTDLEPLLSPDGSWLPDQTDSDGDGTGDVCE